MWLFLPWESLLDWPFCSSNFSFSLRLQLIQFSSFDNIVCFSITGGQDQNDRVWVLGVLVRTGLKAKIVFHPRVLSIGFYLKEISSWKLSSIVSNWSERSSEEHSNFPFQPLTTKKTFKWGFKITTVNRILLALDFHHDKIE